MDVDNQGYYSSGSLELGVRPHDQHDLQHVSMDECIGTMLRVQGVKDTCVLSANNEYTFVICGDTHVRYRFTTIVMVQKNGDIYLDTGGWNNASTRRHILNALRRIGWDGVKLSGQKSIRGINISAPNLTDDRGVFFKCRGVFKGGVGGTFESDLGYTQELPAN